MLAEGWASESRKIFELLWAQFNASFKSEQAPNRVDKPKTFAGG